MEPERRRPVLDWLETLPGTDSPARLAALINVARLTPDAHVLAEVAALPPAISDRRAVAEPAREPRWSPGRSRRLDRR